MSLLKFAPGGTPAAKHQAPTLQPPTPEVCDVTHLFRLVRELGLDAQQIGDVEALLQQTAQRRREIDQEWRTVVGNVYHANQVWLQRLAELHRWVDQEIAKLVRPDQYGVWRENRDLRLTLIGKQQRSA